MHWLHGLVVWNIKLSRDGHVSLAIMMGPSRIPIIFMVENKKGHIGVLQCQHSHSRMVL